MKGLIIDMHLRIRLTSPHPYSTPPLHIHSKQDCI
ncbi:predicted protein [Botrytis cinerea T4]|uniref:Uncharacterized protein n=1 Tax=Botryotinia fuckeliana (strain T4) TaxID=999810 RepID=G2Y9Y1_BOTF4|nr:predicted protein [Botrytis cinerea T4]